ncbi:MAG TPA: PAS domain S-box protein [Thermoanaerobaculia bacterium]|jgi:PAS domain S-box-containing protein
MRIPIVGQMLSLVRKSGGTQQRTVAREDRIRAAFALTPVGIAFASPDGHWLFVNDRFRELTGYTREELARISLDGITHPDDAKKELSLMKKLVAGDLETYRIEKRLMAKDGRYRALEVLTAAVRRNDGEMDLLIYVADDPQARPHGEPARESDRMLATVLDQLGEVAVIRTDEHGVIRGWNAGAERIFGYTREEILGHNRRMLHRDADSWKGRSTGVLQSASAEGKLEQDDWRVTRSGAHVWVRSTVRPVIVDGLVQGYVETITPPPVPKTLDTTPVIEQLRAELDKRKRTEDSLRVALDDLRRTSEETMNELRIMTAALRDEIDRRKATEEQLRQANEQLAAPPIEIEIEENESLIEPPPERTWHPLEDATPADVLRAQMLVERTGTLLFANGAREKEVFFENGRIFSCSSNDPEMFLAQRLVAARVITEEQRRIALEIKQASQLALGRILLVLGAISEAQLVAAMRAKVEDEIRELLAWTDGRYVFVEGEVPSLQLVPLRIDVESLLSAPADDETPVDEPPVEEALAPPLLYVASTKTKKVHLATCKSAKRITGAARLELATADGYERCRQCLR